MARYCGPVPRPTLGQRAASREACRAGENRCAGALTTPRLGDHRGPHRESRPDGGRRRVLAGNGRRGVAAGDTRVNRVSWPQDRENGSMTPVTSLECSSSVLSGSVNNVCSPTNPRRRGVLNWCSRHDIRFAMRNQCDVSGARDWRLPVGVGADSRTVSASTLLRSASSPAAPR